MKIRKLFQGCLISLLINAILMMNVSASTFYTIFFTGYMQEKSNWCWVASAETSAKYMLQSRGMTASQHDQYSTVYHLKGSNQEPYPNRDGSITDTANAANYISGNKFSYVGYNEIRTQFFLISQINSQKMPITGAGYYNSSGTRTGGHATPIFGMYVYDNGVIRIGYYDPDSGEALSCTFEDFCNGSFNGRKYDQTCYT